jgi:hypothetical protein
VASCRGATTPAPSMMKVSAGARVLPGHNDPACIAVQTETPLMAADSGTLIHNRRVPSGGLRRSTVASLIVEVEAGGACPVARPSCRAHCLLGSDVLDKPQNVALLSPYLGVIRLGDSPQHHRHRGDVLGCPAKYRLCGSSRATSWWFS